MDYCTTGFQMRNAAYVSGSDEFTRNIGLVATVMVVSIVLLGIMNFLTMQKIEELKVDSAPPKLVLMDPVVLRRVMHAVTSTPPPFGDGFYGIDDVGLE